MNTNRMPGWQSAIGREYPYATERRDQPSSGAGINMLCCAGDDGYRLRWKS